MQLENNIKFTIDEIEGVIFKPLHTFVDSRGWLTEIFREDEIENEFMPKMAYISMTEPGITRGPHEHVDQADMFVFMKPSKFKLFLWDIRKQSSTYLNKIFIEVGENNPCMVIIPSGVVHAYKNIGTKQGVVYNLPNRLFAGVGKKEKVDEVRHESNPDSPFKMDE